MQAQLNELLIVEVLLSGQEVVGEGGAQQDMKHKRRRAERSGGWWTDGQAQRKDWFRNGQETGWDGGLAGEARV